MSACPKGLKPGDVSPADHRVYFNNGYYGFQRDLKALKINGEPAKSLRFRYLQDNGGAHITLMR
jgi:hypothetical protein